MVKTRSTSDQVQDNTLPAPSEPAPLWRQLKWNGIPLWQCAFCEFDTFDKKQALTHWRTKHAPRIPRKDVDNDISS